MEIAPASLEVIAGQPVLRFERRLAHAPEKVWRAITDPAELTRWFPATVSAELRPGAAMHFSFPDAEGEATSGEILEIERPRLFVFRWEDDVLRWELLPDGAGCRLVFTHALGAAGGGILAAARNAAGWDVCLDALAARLDGRLSVAPGSMLEPIESYVERLGLGEGEVHRQPDGFVVRFERDLVWRPADQVWATLTGQDDTALAVGEAPPLPSTNGYVPAGEVTAVDPPRLLEYSWQHAGAPAGCVRWEISADAKLGTRVVLTQTVPERLEHLRSSALAAWQTHLELFFAAVMGTVRCPWPAERTDHLERMYRRRVG